MKTARAMVYGLLGTSLTLLLWGAPAGAAPGQDPYGPTTTSTAPPVVQPECQLSVSAGGPGTSVTATITNAPQGQSIRILFDGQLVGEASPQAEVEANAAGPAVLFGGAAAAAGAAVATVEIDFVVPNRSPGRYMVAAVGATFAVECGPAFAVSAGAVGRADVGGSSGGSRGSLPRTGIYIGLLLALAAALLLVGRTMTEEGKRRRRPARSTGATTRAGE